MRTDKKLILNTIQEELGFEKDADFARHLGISPQVLYTWKARGTYKAQILSEKCPEINPMFILRGQEPVSADLAMAIVMNSDEYIGFIDKERKSVEGWQKIEEVCKRKKHLGEPVPSGLLEYFSKVVESEGQEIEQVELENLKDSVIAQQEERIKELKEYIELLKEKVK
ncbi:hypothetical protein [Algoriphagus aquimarinus]|uniref:hypothetical protein n=1 Tax=Algoriphagus aquimarinus TaxID=237018 RepID=UPI0030DCFE03|tara:strand:+ start:26301 stop:26807 length:507 start_codon:yes stop_codon:yes gene_type:complete